MNESDISDDRIFATTDLAMDPVLTSVFERKLEDHCVVVKDKGKPTRATEIFRDHTAQDFGRIVSADMDQVVKFHDEIYREKHDPEAPSVRGCFYVAQIIAEKNLQWVERFQKQGHGVVCESQRRMCKDYIRGVKKKTTRTPSRRNTTPRTKEKDYTTSSSSNTIDNINVLVAVSKPLLFASSIRRPFHAKYFEHSH
jgi:hypothetical protein